ncbi:MuF-like minor capsid protein [Gordonia phage Tolls]|nr:MuF-like minor capsid protein [Gordonia phage Tolls]
MWKNPPLLDDQKFWEYMQDAYVDLAEPVLTLAAEAGASYYEMAGGDPVVADITPEEALRKTARWAMAKGNATTGLQLLSGSLEGHVYSAAQDSVQQSAEAEPGATWARRARPNACGFCKMLATRKDVYASAESALRVVGRKQTQTQKLKGEPGRTRGKGQIGDKYHDCCRCLAVAVRPGQVYRPPSYVERWEEEYQSITREVGTDNPDAIVAAWDQLAS